MPRTLLLSLAALTGLWIVLLAGLGAVPRDPSAQPQYYAHTGTWTLYQTPSGQASVSLRDLRAI
ncbi:MAG: hypothetical protein ACE5JZ_06330 [Kiloniellales bacterium]